MGCYGAFIISKVGCYDAFVMGQTDSAELRPQNSLSCKFPSSGEILPGRFSLRESGKEGQQLPFGSVHVPFLALPSNAIPGAAVEIQREN